MQLDIRTMLVSQTLLGILTTSLMFNQWKSLDAERKEARWWTLSFGATTVGQVLIALRGILPYFLTLIPANLSLTIGMIAFLNGICIFLRIKLPRSYVAALLVTVTASCLLFGHLFEMVRFRIIVLNGIFLINSVYAAVILFRYGEPTCRRNIRAVAVTQIAYALTAALRIYGGFALTVAEDWLHASQWEAGGILAMTITQVAAAFTLMGLVDAYLRSQLAKSADDKTLLVREMHHRTKNDFALVESLISLETAARPEPESNEALERVRNRIHSFALLHDRLYRGKTTGMVDAGEYLSLIAAGLLRGGTRDGSIKLRTKVDLVETDAGSAVSLGLIVNELITNAIKHAFPGGREGRIDLSLRITGENACLEVKDDGVGFPADKDDKPPEGLGMTLIAGLVAQINGTMERFSKPGGGVHTRLHFPLPGGQRSQ